MKIFIYQHSKMNFFRYTQELKVWPITACSNITNVPNRKKYITGRIKKHPMIS